jgi:hypothetical protein
MVQQPYGPLSIGDFNQLKHGYQSRNDGAKRFIYGYFVSQPIDLTLEDIFIGNQKQEAGKETASIFRC